MRFAEFGGAFQFTDYVIIHVDTDQCDAPNFDVPKQENNVDLKPRELIARIVEKLKEKIGDQVWELFGDRVIFAIAVDSIECWLLPLYADVRRRTRYVHCLEPLNRALQTRNVIKHLSKNYRDYEKISRPYAKQRTLMQHLKDNEGLEVFCENLQMIKLSPLEATMEEAKAMEEQPLNNREATETS